MPILPVCVVLAACGGEVGRDAAADVPELRGRVTLELGAVEGPPELIFGGITGVAQDAAGRIFVADGQADDIRAFDRQGRFLFIVASRGEGPGEVSGPCCLAIAPDGSLWVRDNGNGRYGSFVVQGDGARSVNSVRMSHAAGNLYASTTFIGDTLVDVGVSSDADLQIRRMRFLTVIGGGVVASEPVPEPTQEELGGRRVEVDIRGMRGIMYLSPPFGPRHLRAHGPGGVWADARSDAYHVRLHRRGGDTILITRATPRGPPLSDAERERAREQIEGDRRRAGSAARQVDWGVPDTKQPLEALFFDASGRLWVELTVAEGAPRRADVYESDGRRVEQRIWPGRVDLRLPAWVGAGRALGVTRDSLGVQRVARVEWSR